MKTKWLGIFLFVGMIAGFASCYCPYGYHGYSDYYGYGPGYYGQGKYNGYHGYSGYYGYGPSYYGHGGHNGYHGYSGYYGYGPSYYGHGQYARRDQGHAYHRTVRPYSRPSY